MQREGRHVDLLVQQAVDTELVVAIVVVTRSL